MTLDALIELVHHGERTQARRALTQRIDATQTQPQDHDEHARLAEKLGMSTAAMRAWQLHLRDHDDDQHAWGALAELHEERGDLRRARSCRERTGELGQQAQPLFAPEPPPAPGVPSVADLHRFVHLFGGRQDHHARMWHTAQRGTGYSPVRQPLSTSLVQAHLEGAITLGSYNLRMDGTVGWICLDLDAKRSALEKLAGRRDRAEALRRRLLVEALRMRQHLVDLGLDPLLEDSGRKGFHLWLFLDPPLPALDVRAAMVPLARQLAPADPDLSLELFPKQDRLASGGLGNLVKLPLGMHLRSGRRCLLLDQGGQPVQDPWPLLREVRLGGLPRMDATVPPPPAVHPPRELPPAPIVEEVGFNEARLDTSPQVAPVLTGCGLLRALVQRSVAQRTLSRDEVVSLQHSLGHLVDGVEACNWLCHRVPGFPAEQLMGAAHRGSPISCNKLRKRLKHLPEAGDCDCIFPEEPGRYPNPLRHLEIQPKPQPPRRTLDDLLREVSQLEHRVNEAQTELDQLRGQAIDALRRVPGATWSSDGTTWRVQLVDGLPVLDWSQE